MVPLRAMFYTAESDVNGIFGLTGTPYHNSAPQKWGAMLRGPSRREGNLVIWVLLGALSAHTTAQMQ